MEHLIAGAPRLRLVVDGTTGALRAIEHRARRALAHRRPRPRRAASVYGDPRRRHDPARLAAPATVQPAGIGAVDVRWTLDRGLAAGRPTCSLDAAIGRSALHGGPAESREAARCRPGLSLYRRDRPAGRRRRSGDELVHPYATGFLVRDPLDHLPPVVSETAGEQPVVLGLYPEGFSGSTMQFMAYSAAGRGGFYIATEDGEGREKWLNFYRHPDGDLRLAVWHSPGDYAEQPRRAARRTRRCWPRSMAAPGTTRPSATKPGRWRSPGPRTGPLWARDDRPRWLLEQVGAVHLRHQPALRPHALAARRSTASPARRSCICSAPAGRKRRRTTEQSARRAGRLVPGALRPGEPGR